MHAHAWDGGDCRGTGVKGGAAPAVPGVRGSGGAGGGRVDDDRLRRRGPARDGRGATPAIRHAGGVRSTLVRGAGQQVTGNWRGSFSLSYRIGLSHGLSSSHPVPSLASLL